MSRIQLHCVVRITSSSWTPPAKPGDVVWVPNEDAARQLIEAGLCRLADGKAEPVPAGGIARRSSSWPVDRFAVIDRTWEGQTVACIGGGPSLTAEDLERIKGRTRIIAINDAYLVAPEAEVCYFADSRWWQWHTDGIAKQFAWAKFSAEQVKAAFAAFKGQKITIENTGLMIKDPAVFMVHNDTDVTGQGGLCEKPNAIRTGSNGGYQAMNLATLAGAKRILLLAYDMRFPGGKSHAHNGHPQRTAEDAYYKYARNFASMLPQLRAWGVEVINCTPGSALTCFPIKPLNEVLR